MFYSWAGERKRERISSLVRRTFISWREKETTRTESFNSSSLSICFYDKIDLFHDMFNATSWEPWANPISEVFINILFAHLIVWNINLSLGEIAFTGKNQTRRYTRAVILAILGPGTTFEIALLLTLGGIQRIQNPHTNKELQSSRKASQSNTERWDCSPRIQPTLHTPMSVWMHRW